MQFGLVEFGDIARRAPAIARFLLRCATSGSPSREAASCRRARPTAYRHGEPGPPPYSRHRRDRSIQSYQQECEASLGAEPRCRVESQDSGKIRPCDATAPPNSITVNASKSRRSLHAPLRGETRANRKRSDTAIAASIASRCARTNLDKPNSAATMGSSLALKSCSTAANCGKTNKEKKRQARRRRQTARRPDSARHPSPSGASPRRGCVRCRARREHGRARRTTRPREQARRTSAGTMSDDARALPKGFRPPERGRGFAPPSGAAARCRYRPPANQARRRCGRRP